MSVGGVFCACLSGLLMALSFPHWDLWPLAWVGMIPLFHALNGRTPREAAALGWIGGTLHYCIVLYWLVQTMQAYGNLHLSLAAAVMSLLALYLALYWALFGAVLTLVRSATRADWIWIAPPLWCALEALRGVFLSGFPWALLGYSQWRLTRLIQIADLTGVLGLSFLLVWTNCALWGGLMGWRAQGLPHRRWALLRLGASVAMAGAAILYGAWRVQWVMAISREAPHVTVGIAQGNIEQHLKWNPDFQETTFRIYRGESLEAAKRGARLLVWPETAAPFLFQEDAVWRDRLLALSAEVQADILFGALAKGEGKKFYNRAYLIGPDRQVRGLYDKMHLVPFGEYVPLQSYLPFVRRMAHMIGDFSAGQDPRPLVSSTGASVGVMICFESLFPEISRAFSRGNANLLANITNDMWFGDTAAPHQHLTLLTFRAVENRRWIVRAANTGISAFIDPAGRIVAEAPLFEPAVLVDNVSMLQVHSFYSRHGDLFSLACSLWAGGMVLVSLGLAWRRRHDAFP